MNRVPNGELKIFRYERVLGGQSQVSLKVTLSVVRTVTHPQLHLIWEPFLIHEEVLAPLLSSMLISLIALDVVLSLFECLSSSLDYVIIHDLNYFIYIIT